MKIRIPGWVKGQPVPSDLYSYTDASRPTYKITVNGRSVLHRLQKMDIIQFIAIGKRMML